MANSKQLCDQITSWLNLLWSSETYTEFCYYYQFASSKFMHLCPGFAEYFQEQWTNRVKSTVWSRMGQGDLDPKSENDVEGYNFRIQNIIMSNPDARFDRIVREFYIEASNRIKTLTTPKLLTEEQARVSTQQAKHADRSTMKTFASKLHALIDQSSTPSSLSSSSLSSLSSSSPTSPSAVATSINEEKKIDEHEEKAIYESLRRLFFDHVVYKR